MSKRADVDWKSLTVSTATPMPEAVQRTAPQAVAALPATTPAARKEEGRGTRPARLKKATPPPSELTESLNFKVTPEFRRRFRQSALAADLQLNQLLYACFETWEKQNQG